MKANPSYYGANSSKDEDVEHLLLEVAKDTLKLLAQERCITIDGKSDKIDSEVRPSSLGAAASEYYLSYRTPKQIQFGLKQCAKMIMNDKDSNEAEDTALTFESRPFLRPQHMDELSTAWILYTISCTHEFDELPVRHNEEFLNEELSRALKWGPDTSRLMSSTGRSTYVDPEIYAQPHTK